MKKDLFFGASKSENTLCRVFWPFRVKRASVFSFLAFKAMLRPWGTRALELFAVTFNLSLSTRSNDFSWKWDVAGTDSHFCCGCGDWICCENAKNTFSVLNVSWFAFSLDWTICFIQRKKSILFMLNDFKRIIYPKIKILSPFTVTISVTFTV